MSENFVASHNVWVLKTDHRFNFGIPHGGFPARKFSLENFQG
jgi:hypothetical protein